jgi:hypothetical protein
LFFKKREVSKMRIHYLTCSRLKGVAHLIYEVRIPVVADEDLEIAQRQLHADIEGSSFKVEKLGLIRKRMSDLLYLRVVYGEKEHFKEMLNVVAKAIAKFEDYLYVRSMK